MDPNDKDFQDEFQASLGTEAIEITKDLSEVAFHELASNHEVLKSLPVVGVLVSLMKTGAAVRDYRFAKKFTRFVNQVNRGQIDKTKLEEKKRQWLEHPHERARTIEVLCSIIDRLFDERKAALLSGVFVGYLNGDINWDELVHIAFCLEQLHPIGYEGLKELWETKGHARSYYQQRRDLPLKISVLIGNGFVSYENSTFHLNALGTKFWECAVMKNPAVEEIGSQQLSNK